jgi:hypothetical protein
MIGVPAKIHSRASGKTFLLGYRRTQRLQGLRFSRELVQRSPDRYQPTQVRTLQRHLGKLRAQLLVTFDDPWDNVEANGFLPTPELRAEIMSTIS